MADEVSVTVFPGTGPGDEPPAEDAPAADALPRSSTSAYRFEQAAGEPVYFWVRVEKHSARSDLYLTLLDLDDQLSCQVLQESTALLGPRWEQQFALKGPAAGPWPAIGSSSSSASSTSGRTPSCSHLRGTRCRPSSRRRPTSVRSPTATAGVGRRPPPGPDSCAITIRFDVHGT
ncbi:MAG: hypothetical protein R2705_08810 [Ilumatobacteraceae bacterium]